MRREKKKKMARISEIDGRREMNRERVGRNRTLSRADEKLTANDVNDRTHRWESLAFSISLVRSQNFPPGCSLFTSVNECICPALTRLCLLSTRGARMTSTFNPACWSHADSLSSSRINCHENYIFSMFFFFFFEDIWIFTILENETVVYSLTRYMM